MKVFGNWWLWLRSTIYETQCKKNAKTFARKGHFTSRCLKLFAKCHLKTSCQKFSISVLIEAIAHFMIKKIQKYKVPHQKISVMILLSPLKKYCTRWSVESSLMKITQEISSAFTGGNRSQTNPNLIIFLWSLIRYNYHKHTVIDFKSADKCSRLKMCYEVMVIT